MKRIVQALLIILLCLLYTGCHTGGIKFTQGENELGESYITDGEYRYIRLHTTWSFVSTEFDTYIGTIENSNMILYASAQDPNRVLLKPEAFLEDRLALFIREDLFPDASKEKVAFIRVLTTVITENEYIEYGNPRMIDDAVAIEQLNSLLFSQEPGIKSSAYELEKGAGWLEAYKIHYFYAQTDQIYRSLQILLSPENEYYLCALSGEYLKIEDGRLKDLIMGIPSG